MATNPGQLWAFLPLGYVLTIALEMPVLLAGLAPVHRFSRRVFAGLLLTAATYPIVILVLPLIIAPRFGYRTYVGLAEIFAPAAECLLFYVAFDREETRRTIAQDMLAIVAANLFSWLFGAWLLEQPWLKN